MNLCTRVCWLLEKLLARGKHITWAVGHTVLENKQAVRDYFYS